MAGRSEGTKRRVNREQTNEWEDGWMDNKGEGSID